MTKRILLPNNTGTVLVSDRDFDLVKPYRWHLSGGGYAIATIRVGSMRKTITMQRLILGMCEYDTEQVDHANRNRLDNRRGNLRTCSASQNAQNRMRRPGGSSSFKGVGWDRKYGKWRATLCVHGQQRHIGYFHSEQEAAQAYDQAALQEHGQFAYLNMPEAPNGT